MTQFSVAGVSPGRQNARFARARRAHRELCALGALGALSALVAACAEPSGTLVIVQNQVPSVDSATNACVVSPDSSAASLQAGKFDVDLDRPYHYNVYPLVQSRLPSIKTSGGIERNAIALSAVRVAIKAPPGVNPDWAPGCPGTFDSPASALLDPAQARGLVAEGFQACHGQRLAELIAAGAIPSDLSQPVFFTLELTAVADRSGTEQLSDPFRFHVQVCAGCLQSMYPLTPTCVDAPKPNPFPGNPCNIAQDSGPVLCCTNVAGTLICPAPDI